jgi:predicted DNA-binding transcriptional regulator AlpA
LNEGNNMVDETKTTVALEKIPSAALRMGLSVSMLYRVAKRDGLTIVKIGERASAVIVSEVDSWIARRIDAAKGRRA